MEISPSCYLSTKFITTVQELETNQQNTGTGPDKLGFHQQILENLSIPLDFFGSSWDLMWFNEIFWIYHRYTLW